VHRLDGIPASPSRAAPRRRGGLRWWRTARRRSPPAAAPVETPPPASRLEAERQWQIVAGIAAREAARGAAIAALHARAAIKIDAAEHALNRILADCAKVLGRAA
jgi:hypothetical protein